MKLYSFKGAYPSKLPNRIKISEGITKTDNLTFTEQDLLLAGWYEVQEPPTVNYPNRLTWVGEELSWEERAPNQAETAFKWQEIQKECQKRLSATDYLVIKALEKNTPVDPNIARYRQELRDLYNNVNNEDPWFVAYPTIYVEPDETTEPVSSNFPPEEPT